MPRPSTPAAPPSVPGVAMPDSWDARMTGANLPAVPWTPPSTPPPSVGTPRVVARQRRGPSRTVLMLGVVAVFAVTAAAASIAWKLSGRAAPTPTASQPAPPTPPPGAQPGTPQPSAGAGAQPGVQPSAQSSAKPNAQPSASAAAKPGPVPSNKAQCFATLLPDNAFGKPLPRLDDACTATNAYNAMLVIKAAIVRAGGPTITPAMDEWSKLAWYETAAFAAMRAHCCADASALTTPAVLSRCKMDEALAYIANALDDDKAMKEALEAYGKAARCIAGLGSAGAFGRWGAPYGGEDAYFGRVYGRIKKARGR